MHVPITGGVLGAGVLQPEPPGAKTRDERMRGGDAEARACRHGVERKGFCHMCLPQVAIPKRVAHTNPQSDRLKWRWWRLGQQRSARQQAARRLAATEISLGRGSERKERVPRR